MWGKLPVDVVGAGVTRGAGAGWRKNFGTLQPSVGAGDASLPCRVGTRGVPLGQEPREGAAEAATEEDK